MHRDIVYPPLPLRTQSLGSSPRCTLQGLYDQNNLITVQGHPEFDEEIVRELLEARNKTGVFDDEMFEDAMSRVERAQDGVVVAEAFLRFLLEGDRNVWKAP